MRWAMRWPGPAACRIPDVRPGDGELKRLYVLHAAQNSGWGGRLFQAALDWLERDGPRTLWISVWSENFGAQRFYARHGFEKVGEYEFPVGRVRDREFMLRRRRRAHEPPRHPAAWPVDAGRVDALVRIEVVGGRLRARDLLLPQRRRRPGHRGAAPGRTAAARAARTSSRTAWAA